MKQISIIIGAALLSVNVFAFDIGSAINKGVEVLGNGGEKSSKGSTTLSSLSSGEVSKGLKEALGQGIDTAIKTLGVKDGYFGDQLVKIMLPKSMQNIADIVSKAGGEKYVNDLVLSMNRAAEGSVKKVAPIFEIGRASCRERV